MAELSNKQPLVSIVIPCLNEARFIEQVIQDILNQRYPQEKLEVFFVDGGSTDGTQAIIQSYSKKNSGIKLLDNPEKFVPIAMNTGIKAANGEIIIRMDAHAGYPSEYVDQLVQGLQETKADNVGGIWITAPRSETQKAKAIATALAHPLGVGNSLFRIGVDEPKEVDTVPFGCYPKEAFEKYGYYDERLQRNQDIELNKRIRQAGGRILLLPNISCTYYARDTYTGLWRNNFGTGRWVILTSWLTKNLSALSLRHFVPLGFVSYLFMLLIFLGLFLAGLLPLWGMLVSLLPLALYLVLLLYTSFRQKSNTHFGYLLGAFITLHLSYGFGSYQGILDLILQKHKR